MRAISGTRWEAFIKSFITIIQSSQSHQISLRLWSNCVRQRINEPTPESGLDSVKRFEAVLWSDDNHVYLSATGRVRRSSSATATTTTADQVRRQSESDNESHCQECLRRSLDDSLRLFQRQQQTAGCESQPVLWRRRHDKRQRAPARNHAAWLVALPEVDRSLTLEVSRST